MKNKKVLGVIGILLSLVLVMLTGLFIYFQIGDIYKDTRVMDLSKLDNYKDFDGTYASMKNIVYNDYDTDKIYKLNMGFDGKVYAGNFGNKKYITNVENVIDIVSFNNGIGGIDVQQCYILTSLGEVYVYNITDLVNEKYEATKIDDLNNIDRLINFTVGTTRNASAAWGMMAVTKDGEYITITTVGA
jgi:hypothetical protein